MLSRRPATLALGNLIFWAALWYVGAPLTVDDDLFFVGPAIQLHAGQPLSNPLIRFWHPEAAHSFFFQPPLFQYVLAGWLNVFGLSAGAISGLICALGAVASFTGGLVLRRVGLHGAWFVPLVIAAATVSKGMRHDVLALALLCGGLYLLTRRTHVSLIAGSALLVAVPMVWPILACYAGPIGLALLVRDREWWRATTGAHLACVAGGALVAVAVFLVAIDGAVADFLRLFRWHAALRREPDVIGEMISNLTEGRFELTHGPLYVVSAALITFVILRRRRVPLLAGLSVTVLIGIALTIVGYAGAWHGAAVPFLLLIVGILALNLAPAGRRPLVSAGVVALVVLTNAVTILTFIAVRPERPEYYRTVAAQLPRDVCLGIDAVAARYVFNYQLPACAFDYMYADAPSRPRPQPGDTPPPGTAWVTSQAPGAHTAGLPLDATLKILGIRMKSVPVNYLRIRILRSGP